VLRRVAKKGFEAMMNGDSEVISGWHNQFRTAIGIILPADMTAAMHGNPAAFDSSKKSEV